MLRSEYWKEKSVSGGGGYRGQMRRFEVHIYYMYIYEDGIMKPTKYCLRKGRKVWGYIDGMNLSKVNCIYF
jgi:hypothetical protein